MIDTLAPVDELSVPRTSGTHADVFAAVGLADLLANAFEQPVRLEERADRFVVRLPAPLTRDITARLPATPGYPFIKTKPTQEAPKGGEECLDYAASSERAKRYRELLRDKKASQDPEFEQELQQLRPRPDWRLIQVLNSLQGDDNTNRVHYYLSDPAEATTSILRGVVALQRGEARQLKWGLTSVQLFTPIFAKGYARLKPDGAGRNDKTKEQWVDPFLEWMKYRGYFRVACPYFQGSKGEHVRLFCPVPADISVGSLVMVTENLRTRPLAGGPPKMDALAVLHLAEIMIRHSEEYHKPGDNPIPGLFMGGRRPSDLISGMMVTYYQSLGQAKAVSAMSVLAVPGWFPVTDQNSSEDWLLILDEHRRVVRSLRDDHSDEISLLLQYRRFLERRGESAFQELLDFMGAYGAFMLRAREQKRRVASFRTDHLRRLAVALTSHYTEILSSPGFQAIATAVRKATVSAQAQKAMGQQGYREIRYDLLPELRRKRSLPGGEAFMEAVAEFVASYNSENARRWESHRPTSRNVTTEEFREFAALVEQYGASLVGALLCAYGSCREPQDETDRVAEEKLGSVPGATTEEGVAADAESI